MNSFSIIAKARELRALLENLADDLPDEEAYKTPYAYPAWSGNGVSYSIGDRVRYGDKLYKCIQAHTSQADWQPTDAVSLFVEVSPEGTIPDWKQPTGAADAYQTGDKVRYNGKIYESIIDNNVWSPADYPQGWREVA